jgi:DNA-binding transcriptional LysR family regulator
MLLAIDETRSVSAAALKLGLSQPAASNCLGRLRTALDDPLFVRSRDGMRPTRFATEILPGIRQNFEGLLATIGHEPHFEAASSTRMFRLSMSDLGEIVFLPKLVQHLMTVAPNLGIRNVQVPVPSLEASLESGAVDLALGMIDIAGHGIRSETLFHETYVPIAGRDVTETAERIEELSTFRLVVPVPLATYASDLIQTMKKAGLMQHIKLQTASFGVLPQVLQSGEFVAIVPRQLAMSLQESLDLRIFPIEITPTNTATRMVWSGHSESDPGMIWLRNTITDLFHHGSMPNPKLA